MAHIKSGILPNGDPRVWDIADDIWRLSTYVSTSMAGQESVRHSTLLLSSEIFGKKSPEYEATELFCGLAHHVDNISIRQLQKPRENVSWADYSGKDAKEMDRILTQHKSHPSSQLLSAIIHERNPKVLARLAKSLDELQAKLSLGRIPLVYSTYFDDYVNPNRPYEENRTLWLANLILLIPVPTKLHEQFKTFGDKLWSRIALGFGIDSKPNASPPPVSLFFSVLGAGTEIISPTVAQASEGRGIQFFINRLGKVNPYWKAMAKLSGVPFTNNVFMEAAKLFIAHESGHDASNFRKAGTDSTSILDESETDHLASRILLEDTKDPQSSVFALTVENIYQILTTPPNASGKFAGYEITARLNLNALVSSGLIYFDFRTSKLHINPHPENIRKFVTRMESLHKAILNNDSDKKAEMLKVELIPEALTIVNNFKQVMGR